MTFTLCSTALSAEDSRQCSVHQRSFYPGWWKTIDFFFSEVFQLLLFSIPPLALAVSFHMYTHQGLMSNSLKTFQVLCLFSSLFSVPFPEKFSSFSLMKYWILFPNSGRPLGSVWMPPPNPLACICTPSIKLDSHLICLSSLSDHCPGILVAQLLKTIVSYFVKVLVF